MFTGLIEAFGTIRRIDSGDGGRRFLFFTGLTDEGTAVGDSIAVNGVCLTVTQLVPGGFWADASSETLDRSTLGDFRPGQEVNLERALRVGDRLGGHFVTGHVDCKASVASVTREGQTVSMEFQLPSEFLRYVAIKGSIAVDGVSLTVNSVSRDRVGVRIIPHTLAQTTLQSKRPGEPVNIETDMIAKYLDRLFHPNGPPSKTSGINPEFLAKHGFS